MPGNRGINICMFPPLFLPDTFANYLAQVPGGKELSESLLGWTSDWVDLGIVEISHPWDEQKLFVFR